MQLQHDATAPPQLQWLAYGDESVAQQPRVRRFLLVMGQYNGGECKGPIGVHHDATEHECEHLDAVNRSRTHGLRAESPCCSKRHQTVRADTCCFANVPHS
ncbi:hypothetical protein TNCV_4903651 [Trichonephila clavipes]|uniref:Uncharacterized protein n=1 Tax=Trichonephila clavipes TaxID=2585209 RepID=A0A8X6S972_TRICX|nr:hypothetical protein TNCV_4903651 [Trichonephila clavipes]